MGIMVILNVFWPRKTKPNKANLLAFSVRRSADSVEMRKRKLKKQSQFAPVQADVKSYSKGDYGNKPTFGAKKTKPNKANLFRTEYCVMRIAKRNMKKQSQFGRSGNKLKVNCTKELQRKTTIFAQKKQSQAKPIYWRSAFCVLRTA